VCPRDIGAAAAAALVAPTDGTRVVELAGEQDWSVEDIAAAVGKLLGKPGEGGRRARRVGAGGLERPGVASSEATLSESSIPLFAEMYAGIASGLVAFERPQAVTRGSTPLVDALRAVV
jgi:uncharacterized protein YbjT (DUF2867 family)